MSLHKNFLRSLALVAAGAVTAVPQVFSSPFSWLLSVIGLGCAVWLTNFDRRRSAWLQGLFFAMGYFVTTLQWLSIVGKDVVLLVSLICALWWALAFSLSAPYRKSRWFPCVLGVFLTTADIARDTFPWGGFGWAQYGSNVVDSPFAFMFASVSQTGVSFLMIVLVGLCVQGIEKMAGSGQRDFRGAYIYVALVVIVAGLSVVRIGGNSQLVDTVDVSFVQGGVDHTGLGVLGDPRSVLLRHIALSQDNIEILNETDLVVWPENASDVDPYFDAIAADGLQNLDRNLEPPLLFGAVINRADGRAGNVSLLLQNNLSEVYAKRRLVPFGEFMPYRDLISSLTSRAELMPRDFAPGVQSGQVGVGDLQLGVVICFEVADQMFLLEESKNVDGFVVHTNNATYAGTTQIQQQVAASRIRAIETGKPVLVVSTSGVSGLVSPDGVMSHVINEQETGVRVVTIAHNDRTTIASYLVRPLTATLWSVGLVLVVMPFTRRFKVML